METFKLLRPLLFSLEAERAHIATVNASRLLSTRLAKPDLLLESIVAGLRLPNPVGLAAGFDKNAHVPRQMLGLGFGFVEVGTLTPLPQAGNPKPRLFRLVEDGAVINRMGFNNEGQVVAHVRLEAARRGRGVIGVNIGANKDAAHRIADYVTGVRTMAGVASYLTINISSPNTPGLRALQDKGALAALLDAIAEARVPGGPPVFLKVAPDLEPSDIDDIAALAITKEMDALIVSNTTISRPPLRSRHAREAGGLSGAPLRTLAAQRLKDFRTATGGTLPLIAVGGIADAEEAYARIRAGASLVQLYTALVYHGPGLVRRINRDLKTLLIRDGFASVSEVVGVDA
jgi:dihydroorotate dehydrogenase